MGNKGDIRSFNIPYANIVMKIKCPRQSFLKPLQICSGLVTPKELYNICQFVRISAVNNKIVLQATDLKISFTYNMPMDGVTIEREGELLLPASRLFMLVKETHEEEILLEQESVKEKESLVNGIITTKDGKFKILGEDIGKFPEIPEFKDEESFEISGENFSKLINKTIFATTTERTRYDLENVLIDLNIEGVVRFAATDGKRLAYCDHKPSIIGKTAKKRYTVPNIGLRQIEKIINTLSPKEVKFNFIDNHFVFLTNDVVLSTRLSDGVFPPYEKVIPDKFPHKGKISVKEFTSALRRITVLEDEKNRVIELNFTDKNVNISVQNDAVGNAEINMPIDFSFGTNITSLAIRFNPTFLQDALKCINNNEAEIELKDNKSALFIKDGEDFRYVVLPIRMSEVPKLAVAKEEEEDNEQTESNPSED